ncbi:PAS domain S-box protein [uncultured Methanoregula sp.]|uniref:PAS domain S-box protein n=1 Tax=uncultured Methanoregula sp. TaxID=1005933 RepID=UPI002AAC3DF1|nr:PAS domain S-box protein [uncultured Methanoregula sp.]
MTPSPSSDQNLTLLLIEDDRVDQMAFNRLIRDRHPSYSVRIASSLAEARAILMQEPVDIVICDFYLGDGTPFDIIPDLKERDIPIIVVSGAEDEDSAADAVRKGAYDYLAKDPNYNYLKVLPLTIERAILDKHPRNQDPAAGTGLPPASPVTGGDPPPDKEEMRLRRLVIDQSELIARYRPDGTILFVNDVYCRYFGKTRGDLIGQPFEMFLPEEDRPSLKKQHSHMNLENPVFTFEHRVNVPAWGVRWIRRTDRALFDNAGNVIEFQMVATDITERKQAEEALRESEERYRMLAEYAFDGILIQDLNGSILYANQSILRMFGYSRVEDVLGKNTLAFVAPEFRETVLHDLQNIIKGNQGYLQKYAAIKPNGEKLIIESVGTLIPYHGKTANIVALRDVTERETIQNQLRNELARKRDFINVAAHELRTPLQPVIGYLNLLLDDEAGFRIPDDALEIIKKIRIYAESERHIVSQIMELSLLESIHEHYWPQMMQVTIRDQVSLVIREGKYDAAADITVNIPEETVITSNGPYIHEILDAILSNAVNYSNPPRKIAVSTDESDTELRISVTDNGIGIPPDKLEIIFDPFYISDADKLSRKYGRLGVGLTMARSRAARIRGTISVSSVVGKGSTFTLSLPKNKEK